MASTGIREDAFILCDEGLAPIGEYRGERRWIFPSENKIRTDGFTDRMSAKIVPKSASIPDILYELKTDPGLPVTVGGAQLVSTPYGYRRAEELKKGDLVHMYFGPLPSSAKQSDFEVFSYVYGLAFGQSCVDSTYDTCTKLNVVLRVPYTIMDDAMWALEFVASRIIEYWTYTQYEQDPDDPEMLKIVLKARTPNNVDIDNRLYEEFSNMMCIKGGHYGYRYGETRRIVVPSGASTVWDKLPDYIVLAPSAEHSAGREAFLRGFFRKKFAYGPILPDELDGCTFCSNDKTAIDSLHKAMLLSGVPALSEVLQASSSLADYRVRAVRQETFSMAKTLVPNIWNVPLAGVQHIAIDKNSVPCNLVSPGFNMPSEYFANFLLFRTP